MIQEGIRTLRMGVKSLLLHKLRSCLTALGLLFGVASVIAMLAVGEGANYEALERIRSMGSTNLMVRTQRPPATAESSSGSEHQALTYGLKYEDAARIEALIPSAKHIVSIRETPVNMRRRINWLSSIVLGVPPEYLDVMHLELHEGRWMTDTDMTKQSNVGILGRTAARTLFPLGKPLGQNVSTGSYQFTVVGVLREVGREAGPGGTPLDQCMFVPISTSRARFGDVTRRKSTGSEELTRVELSEIKVELPSIDDVISKSELLGEILHIGKREQDDVTMIVPLELLRQEEATARIFSIVLASIAVISLLVGGIGIMNVMLATVTERTREIGIRRALGATRRHIVEQFLVETAVLSGSGGLLGVGLGLLIPKIVTLLTGTLTVVRPEHVALAFVVSVSVGLSFGIYPAWRAASMDPVDALRHE